MTTTLTTSPRSLLAAYFREIARTLPGAAASPRIDSIVATLLTAEPRLRWILRHSLLQGYLVAARAAARDAINQGANLPRLPNVAPLLPPSEPPPPSGTIATPGGRSPLRFPAIDSAADWLARRQLLTTDDYRQLDNEAQAAAFTIARLKTVDAVRVVRDAVAETAREGGTLPAFRETVANAVAGVFSPVQVETIYRTHVGLAQAAGQRTILESRQVASEFPYLLWSATHDSRTRPDHLAMETHGQNGTAVYRRDDPIWDTLWPPAGWNCRCNVVPLTVEDAARHGSKEAARWHATGTPPTDIVWAARPYPIAPPPNWPSHRGIVAAV